MNCSGTGQFYGTTNETVHLQGLTLTDTEYSHDRVPWHYHENHYFTFILEGGMTERNKKHEYECCAGDLLFHNWQDAHYNIASGQFTRGFHLELNDQWFTAFDLTNDVTQGSIRLYDPRIKHLLYMILKEMKLSGPAGQLAIDALLLELFGHLGRSQRQERDRKPLWVQRIRELLQESGDEWSLPELAAYLQVHPVHLSRHFSRYFGMTLGDYIRVIRLQRALTLLPQRALSLTDISYACGFADQSHFIRSFKSFYAVTPLHYRKILLRK